VILYFTSTVRPIMFFQYHEFFIYPLYFAVDDRLSSSHTGKKQRYFHQILLSRRLGSILVIDLCRPIRHALLHKNHHIAYNSWPYLIPFFIILDKKVLISFVVVS